MPCPEYERFARDKEVADQNALNYVRRFGGENYEGSTWIAKGAEVRNIDGRAPTGLQSLQKAIGR